MVTALLVATALVAVASLVGVVRSDRQRARAERALDELALKHAELLLKSDPTGSAALLERYTGPDRFTRDFLAAEARGLGVARFVGSPHIDTPHLLAASRGAVLSVGEDQRVVLTTASGSRVLASDATHDGPESMAYSRPAEILAYGHHKGGAMVRHLGRGTAERHRADLAVESVAISPEGSRVALLARTGEVVIDPIGTGTGVALPPVPGGRLIQFAGSGAVVVLGRDAVQRLDLATRTAGPRHRLRASDAIAVGEGLVAVGAEDGAVHLLSLESMTPIAVPRPCKGLVNVLEMVPRRPLVAFACEDGTAGALDARTGDPVVSFSSQRSLSALSTSPDGRFLVAAGALATVYVYDLDAALLTRYVGHNAPIGQVAALGDPAAPLVSADVNGVMRVWDLPRPGRRVVMRGTKAIFHAVFSPDSRYLVADGADGVIRLLDRTLGQLTELRGHTDMVYGLAFPPGRDDEVASWGYDGTVRIWSLIRRSALRVLTDHKGLVKDGDYLDSDTLVTIGIDGRLLAWDGRGGAARQLFHVDESLVSLEVLRGLRSVAVTTASGDVYVVSARGDARQLTSDGQSITMLRAAPDGRQLATGTAGGTVRVYGEDGAARVELKASGPIRHIAFSPDSTLLAVASEDGRVHLHGLGGGEAPWRQVPLRARYVAFSPAGHLLAITCNDGTLWVYSLRDRRWSFAQPHAADTYTGQFSPDGEAFASSDSAGVVVLHRIPEIEDELHEGEGGQR